MNRTRSIATLLIVLSAAALAAVPAAEAAGSRGGGNYSAPMSHTYQPNTYQPHTYQRSAPPRSPVFGPGAPARMPRVNTAPNLSPPARNPRVTAPNRGTAATTSGPVHDFRGRDFSRLNADDKALWTRGRWHHGRYHGLYGWWWFAAGYWYWYEEPTYPYPDYVSEEVEPETGEEQPAEATPPEGVTGDVYYYCTDPDGYYPYVSTCNVPWEAVPAAPSQ